MAGSSARRLPFAGEFSPGQIDLFWLLEVVGLERYDRPQLVELIRDKYFGSSCSRYQGAERIVQQNKRAANVLIGAKSYGLISADLPRLTQLGQSMLSMDRGLALDTFAQHILIACHGLDVLAAIERVEASNQRPSKQTIADDLRRNGFDMPRATTYHMILLKWLALAGVVTGYKVDRSRLAFLVKTERDIVDDVDSLDNSHRAFIKALRHLHTADWVEVKKIVEYCARVLEVTLSEDRLAALVIRPLEQGGWIQSKRGSSGRGAKGFYVRAIGKLSNLNIIGYLESSVLSLSANLKSQLKRPLAEILIDVQSDDKYRKGLALEALVLRIAYFLDLAPTKWRLRSNQTGGAEVDLIVENARLVFSRWQIQCKNTNLVSVEDLAKEYGLSLLLHSTVILMVTTGRIPRSVRELAAQIMKQSSIQIALIDGDLLKRSALEKDLLMPILAALRLQASEAMRLKASQLAEI